MSRKAASVEARNRALFKRLVISYHDLTEARAFLNRLSGLHGEDPVPRHDSAQLDAFRIALVVSYARPFSGNRSSSGVATMLPHNFLRSLSTGERSLHKKIVELRNTQFAHSDADPADVSVSVQSMSGALVAMPESRITRLDPAGNELDVLDSILSKLLTAIDVERQRIEATLQFGETF